MKLIVTGIILAMTVGITPAYASSVTGKVTMLMTRSSDGLQYVVLDTPTSGRPACAANHPYFMIADEKSDAGKAQFSMLLSAYLAGKSVTVAGTGECVRWVDGEDIVAVTFG